MSNLFESRIPSPTWTPGEGDGSASGGSSAGIADSGSDEGNEGLSEVSPEGEGTSDEDLVSYSFGTFKKAEAKDKVEAIVKERQDKVRQMAQTLKEKEDQIQRLTNIATAAFGDEGLNKKQGKGEKSNLPNMDEIDWESFYDGDEMKKILLPLTNEMKELRNKIESLDSSFTFTKNNLEQSLFLEAQKIPGFKEREQDIKEWVNGFSNPAQAIDELAKVLPLEQRSHNRYINAFRIWQTLGGKGDNTDNRGSEFSSLGIGGSSSPAGRRKIEDYLTPEKRKHLEMLGITDPEAQKRVIKRTMERLKGK